MSPVNDVGVSKKLGNLDQEYVELANEKEVVKRRVIRINTLVDEIRVDILAGRSTGNAVDDFVVCKFDYPDWGKKKSNLDALQDLIKGKKGELVLVIHRYVDRPFGDCGGPVHLACIAPPESEKGWPTYTLYFGRLTGENLIVGLEPETIGLPTSYHVIYPKSNKMEKVVGPIAKYGYPNNFDLANFEPQDASKENSRVWPPHEAIVEKDHLIASMLDSLLCEGDEKIQVIVGDDNISAFFPGATRKIFTEMTRVMAEGVV